MSTFHREFMGWDRPALLGAAERLLDAAGEGRELDLSSHVVVVPGGRAGRRLRELLLEGQLSRVRPLRPPRVVTVGRLPELLYAPEAPPPPPLAARLAWARALAALPASDLRVLLSRPPEPGDLPGWLALGRVLEGLHRELGAEGLTFGDVASVCGSGLLFDDEPRWSVLARVQDRVLSSLTREGWRDVEPARRRALDAGRLVSPGTLWLVALPELGAVVREMLFALDERVRVLIHAPEAESGAFFPDGTLRPEAWTGRALPLAPEDLFVEGGPGDQADRAFRALGALGAAYAPEEVTVGVADPEVTPYLVQRMDLHGVPVRVAAGRPLARTGPHLLLTALARHLEEGTAGTLAELVRHPDLEAWLADGGIDPGGALRDLDDYRERSLPLRTDTRTLPGGPSVRGWRGSERLRRRLEELLQPFRREAPLAGWAADTARLLERVYGERPLDSGASRDRELAAFAEALRPVLETAEASLADGGPRVRGRTALRTWLTELDEGAVPPRAEDSAVELLGTLELHLDDAPVLVMTGVNDPFLPQSVVGHPFLPDRIRSALGIPDNRRRLARDTYRLTATIHARERAVLIAGRRSGAGDPLRPSPVILQGDPEATARRILLHYHQGPREREGEEARVPAGGDPPGETPGGFGLPPEPVLPAPELPLRIRVTAFRALLENPYLWFLGERIGADRWVDDDARELDPLGFGGLAHRVVEVLGRELRTEAAPERLARGLEDRLAHEVRERFGTRPLPAVRVQVAQLRTRLQVLARVEADERARGWEVMAVEAGPDPEGVPFDVDGTAVYLRGRIDRVDRHAELGWRLLDYKTSETATTPEGDHRRGRAGERRWTNLQLPLYRHLAPLLAGLEGSFPASASGEAVGLGYVTLPRSLEQIQLRMAEWSGEELASADEAARTVLRPLLEGRAVRFDSDAPLPREGDPLGTLMGVGILSAGSDDGDGEGTGA